MPDYLRDLREVINRGEGSELRRKLLLKKLRRYELDFSRRGVDVNAYPQKALCDALDSPEAPSREWMLRLCFSRLVRGDFSDWTGWEYRNEWAMGSYSPEVPTRRWRLEPVNSIAVLGEQGIGDEVMFGSCLPDLMLRVPKVVFECDPRLVPIFARSLPGLHTKARTDITHRGDPVIKYLTAPRDEEAFIPVGDLPRLFRKDVSHFPGKAFLKPLPEMVEKWSHLKGRVGVGWRSRTGLLNSKAFGIENPVCLQYGHWQAETEGMIVPECDLRDDIEDILGICANLSKVVTVPQTIVHFAGAVGCPVEVVKPPVGSSRVRDQFAYRYTIPKMHWYKDCRVWPNLNAWKLDQK